MNMNIIKMFKKNKINISRVKLNETAFSNVHESNIKTCNDLQNAFNCKENYNINY